MTVWQSQRSRQDGLTIVLGAGVSQALGIPGTCDITKAAHLALSERYGEQYSRLERRLRDRFGASYNFEVLAAALEACERFGAPSTSLTYKYRAVEPEISDLKNGLSFESARDMYEMLIQVVVAQVSSNLGFANSDAMLGMQDFFEHFGGRYRLDVVTLNYDLSDEQYLPGAIDGFVGAEEYQTFSSQAFLAEDQSPRIAHLHGSLRFGLREPGFTFVKKIGDVAPRRTRLWTARDDGSLYTALVTGSDKPGKLTLPPYSIYFSWLTSKLLASPRIVIAGYGIGDAHLNIWLANAIRHHVTTKLRVVIIGRFPKERIPEPTRVMFSIAAGCENEGSAELLFRELRYDDGVAVQDRVMLVNTGMPLTDQQLDRVDEFLRR